jgi:hypothetical protein
MGDDKTEASDEEDHYVKNFDLTIYCFKDGIIGLRRFFDYRDILLSITQRAICKPQGLPPLYRTVSPCKSMKAFPILDEYAVFPEKALHRKLYRNRWRQGNRTFVGNANGCQPGKST